MEIQSKLADLVTYQDIYLEGTAEETMAKGLAEE